MNSITWYLVIGLIVGLVIGAVALYLYMPKVAKKKIDNFLSGLKSSNETIGEFLSRILTEQEARRFVNELKRNLSAQIYLRISERSVSENAAHLLVTQVSTRLTPNEEEYKSQQGLFGRGNDMLKNFVKGHVEGMVENNKDYIEQALSNKLHDVIVKNGEDIVAHIVNQEINHILSHPVSSLFQGNENIINKLKQQFSSVILGKI